MVLTLLSAAYDAAAETLTYEVTLLDAEQITDRAFEQEPLTVLDAPREYAEASLFIDSASGSKEICDPDNCLPDCSTRPAFYLERFQRCLPTDVAPTNRPKECGYCAEFMGCSGPVATQTFCDTVNYQCQKLPGYCA